MLHFNPTPVLLALADKGPAGSGPDMTRYLLVCAGLMAAIGIGAYFFKRMIAGTMRSRAQQRSLQVMDMMPLGHKQRVCVVRVYDRTFALGLGDKEVALIAELDPVIAPASDSPSEVSNGQRPTGFRQLFERVRENDAGGEPVREKPKRRALADLLKNGGLPG